MPGVIRTRVGYAGGIKISPTYRDLGDHTETLEVEYDPARISFRELLDVFWQSHSPSARPYSRQYMAAVFYTGDGQKRLALDSLRMEKVKRGDVFTKILPLVKFYPAEDYHQKYYLRQTRDFVREFHAMYPREEDFTASTAAARVNGFLAGKGSTQTLQSEIDSYGLSEETKKKLLAITGTEIDSYCK